MINYNVKDFTENSIELHNKILEIIDHKNPATIMTSILLVIARVLIQNPNRNTNIEDEVESFMKLTTGMLKEYCIQLLKEMDKNNE